MAHVKEQVKFSRVKIFFEILKFQKFLKNFFLRKIPKSCSLVGFCVVGPNLTWVGISK